MWKVTAPTRSATSTYRLCISRIKNGDLRKRLRDATEEVAELSERFETAARAGSISGLPTADRVGSVTRKEMTAVYNSRMAKLGRPGRVVYDEILAAATNGRCPLCGHRQVGSLDHYLPKALYPALSVTPLNLVPACIDCNKAKLDVAPTAPEEVPLHPYFDDVEEEPWLRAEVQETDPASVLFFVVPQVRWDQTLAARVKNHFALLGLSTLYSAQAAEELLNIRYNLETVYAATGAEGVARHLEVVATSREMAHQNSWQTATYAALSTSKWFCEGGFR